LGFVGEGEGAERCISEVEGFGGRGISRRRWGGMMVWMMTTTTMMMLVCLWFVMVMGVVVVVGGRGAFRRMGPVPSSSTT